MLSACEGTWERHKPSGAAPTPRRGHSLTAVAGGKRLVLFGGKAENGDRLGDVQVINHRSEFGGYARGLRWLFRNGWKVWCRSLSTCKHVWTLILCLQHTVFLFPPRKHLVVTRGHAIF